MSVNYEIKFLLPPQAVPTFEMALEEVASAVLTVMIEHGENKGLWELQAIFEGQPDENLIRFCLENASQSTGIKHQTLPLFLWKIKIGY